VPVIASDFLWEATGFTSTGTTVVVTHPDAGGTTAGTTVLVLLYQTATTITLPAGWTNIGAGAAIFALAKSDMSAGETSWTFTTDFTGASAWYMVELDNVALADPYDGQASGSGTVANGATASTGTTQMNAGSSGVAFAVFGAVKAGTTDVQSWSGYTNSFTERVDVAPASGTAGKQIAVAYKLYEGWATTESTATFATSVASASTGRFMLLLRSADASISAPLAFFTGWEFGTHAGMGSTTAGPLGVVAGLPGGTFGTGYAVTTAAAHDGTYGLELTAAASTAYVYLPSLQVANTIVFGGNVQAVSGSGTPVVIEFYTSSTDLQLLYDVTAEKFGLTWVGGSTVWQSGTSSLGSYPWIDVRFRANGTIWHADWMVEGIAQTSPTDLTGMAPALPNIDTQLGGPGSRTLTSRYDNIVISRYYAAYPLGPHTVRLLVPETTGASVSGTAANFNQFTSNGTLAAFASTNGALLDEVPPTVSASSDGVVQVTAAASDYMNFPMGTYTCTSTEIIAGVRALASLWGGTGSGTGTLGFRGYDGTTETTFVAASTSFDPDSLTAISATYPLWYAAMWSGGMNGAWTQQRLDDAALRGGYSTDATPDMGFSAVYLEVAIREAPTVRQITSGEADEFTIDLRVSPYNSASVSYLIGSTHATKGATFTYSVSGTPQTPVYVAALSTQEVVVNADNFGDISDVNLEPDS
jgi:hypothetical protein